MGLFSFREREKDMQSPIASEDATVDHHPTEQALDLDALFVDLVFILPGEATRV